MCMRRSREGQGVRTHQPPENLKNSGFLSNMCLDPLKNETNIQCRGIIGPPEKRHLNGVSLAARCWSDFSGILFLSPHTNYKKRTPGWVPLTKRSGFSHDLSLSVAHTHFICFVTLLFNCVRVEKHLVLINIYAVVLINTFF